MKTQEQLDKLWDEGKCPFCETDLEKYEYYDGNLGDDSDYCPKCKKVVYGDK